MFVKGNGVKTVMRIAEMIYVEDRQRPEPKEYEPNWGDTRPLEEQKQAAIASIQRLIDAGYEY
jgi:hypothetical protein